MSSLYLRPQIRTYWSTIGDNKKWKSRICRFLGISVDNELKFEEQSNAIMKAQRERTVLMRLSKYLDFSKLRIPLKTY